MIFYLSTSIIDLRQQIRSSIHPLYHQRINNPQGLKILKASRSFECGLRVCPISSCTTGDLDSWTDSVRVYPGQLDRCSTRSVTTDLVRSVDVGLLDRLTTDLVRSVDAVMIRSVTTYLIRSVDAVMIRSVTTYSTRSVALDLI
nr:hypothetical protein [Tanacetum cinerariifolium]